MNKKKTVVKKPKAKAKPAPKKAGEPPSPKGKLQDFPLDMLKFEPRMQPRKGDGSMPVGGLFGYHVADLRAALRRKEPLPPVKVYSVAGRGNIVVDGHHTTEAYRQEGRKTVPAEVFEGTWLEAVAAANGANEEHKALKRTHEDKRQAVANMLAELREAGETWSNGRIAKTCKVSDDLVATMLLREPAPLSLTAVDAPRIGADGRTYKPKIAGSRKKKEKAEKAEVPAEPATEIAPTPVAAFDFHGFETHAGVVLRDIDALAKIHGVLNTPRTEGMRRLYREFHQEFTQWHNELVAQAAGKPKGKS